MQHDVSNQSMYFSTTRNSALIHLINTRFDPGRVYAYETCSGEFHGRGGLTEVSRGGGAARYEQNGFGLWVVISLGMIV